MARKTDKPEDSARRAMYLWEACERELHRNIHLEKVRAEDLNNFSEIIREEDAFLSKCMGTSPECSVPIPGETAPLQLFLEATMPDSKGATREKKWREYLEQESGQRGKVAELIIQQKKDGLPEAELLSLRKSFTDFLKTTGAEQNKIRSDKAVRGRSISRISSKFLCGDKLTVESKSVLRMLTEVEIEKEIGKQNMTPKEAENWKVFIQDLKDPAITPPSKIRKKRGD